MKQTSPLVFCLVLGLILLSGCTQETQNANTKPIKEDTEMAIGPSITLEATVVSLTLSSEEDCRRLGYSIDECPSHIYPRDKGVIKIDKIVTCEETSPVTDGREIVYVSVCDKLSIGEMMEVEFLSTRPTKLVAIPPSPEAKTVSPDTPISKPFYPVTKEDGYFVVTYEDTRVIETTVTILPGLEVGSKFRYTGYEYIGKYDIIS